MTVSNNEPDERLLEANEVAALLATTTRHLERLKSSGAMPFTRVGGKIRFRRRDMLEFIQRNTVGGAFGSRPVAK